MEIRYKELQYDPYHKPVLAVEIKLIEAVSVTTYFALSLENIIAISETCNDYGAKITPAPGNGSYYEDKFSVRFEFANNGEPKSFFENVLEPILLMDKITKM